jgi:broad specificity phosphatase PhoE
MRPQETQPAPPARLLLVRHGQIEANVDRRWHGSTDEDLTDLGREQARRVADHLARVHANVVAVYTSQAKRARDTAEPIAQALGVPLALEPGLAEYGIGVLENESYDDLVERHRFFERAEADLAWAPSGGESLGGVGERVVAAWRTIARANPGKAVVVVSHGAAIAAGLAALLHGDPRGWPRYHVRNASVTEIELEPVPRVVAFDVVDHVA